MSVFETFFFKRKSIVKKNEKKGGSKFTYVVSFYVEKEMKTKLLLNSTITLYLISLTYSPTQREKKVKQIP